MSSHSEDYFINFQLTKQCWNLPSDFHSNISFIHTVPFPFNACLRICHILPSVRPSFLWISSASIGQKSVKFDIGSCMKIFPEILAFLHRTKKIGHFTWRPKCFLFLAATLNRHKTFPSSEMASGCHNSPGDVNNSNRFISASVLQRTRFSIHMTQRCIFDSTMCM
jgi:hypothetical protein